MVKRKYTKCIIVLLLFSFSLLTAQSKNKTSRVTLLFMGDIMGHDSQIKAAYDPVSSRYDYNSCFKYLYPLISQADIAIANLEVTLGGKPYKGYPSFSSPEALVQACKNTGIDILTTANNHSCDRGKRGLERTIRILDSLHIKHTGTFIDDQERTSTYPLIIDKNGIRFGFLNYTYGTNDIAVTEPNIVNQIDMQLIENDINQARQKGADMIIILFHWGREYQSFPDSSQISLYQFCTARGVDLVIGSHPHVIQKIEWHQDKSNLVAYSLGNFISNQRPRKRDGGLMLEITVTKSADRVNMIKVGYYLTWVYTPILYGKKRFYILPVSQYEKKPDFLIKSAWEKMKIFAADSRILLNQQNLNVSEYVYDTDTGNWLRK